MQQGKIGIIILAASASTPMGKPKQLLLYQGRSLITNTINAALNSQCNPIVAVLGANAQKIHPEISNFPIEKVIIIPVNISHPNPSSNSTPA
jgi:molybdenum cofactor cytidylyltransferase